MKLAAWMILPAQSLIMSVLIALAREPVKTSVCAVVGDPSKYEGRVITLRGHINWQTETLLIYDQCNGASQGITLVLPKGNVNLGASAEQPVDDTKLLELYINARLPLRGETENGICIGCNWKYCNVDATVAGRFNAVSERRAWRGRGFGNAGRLRFQLIAQSVQSPVAQECKEGNPAKK